jgi:glutathione S-transferase
MAGFFSIDDQYTAKNPKAYVRYLARQYGTGSLCPTNLNVAALADQWMDFESRFFMIFMKKIRIPAEKSSQPLALTIKD